MGDADLIAIVAAILLAGVRENPSGPGPAAWTEDAKRIAIAEALDLVNMARRQIPTRAAIS